MAMIFHWLVSFFNGLHSHFFDFQAVDSVFSFIVVKEVVLNLFDCAF